MKADRILVPLDGSRLAETALPKAVELLSGARGATLILLRAAEAPTLPGIDRIEAQAAVIREAQSYLAAVAERLSEQGVVRIVRSVWYSDAAKAIVEAARVRRVDVIVMGTHRGGGLRRAVRGSVAETVLRRTRTPIVLVSAAGTAEVATRDNVDAPENGRRASPHMISSAGPVDRPTSR